MACDWTLQEFKRLTAFAQQLADPENKAHALSYIENHDQARAVTRFASDAPGHRVASGKLIATYLLTLSGSLIIYEGRALPSSASCRLNRADTVDLQRRSA